MNLKIGPQHQDRLSVTLLRVEVCSSVSEGGESSASENEKSPGQSLGLETPLVASALLRPASPVKRRSSETVAPLKRKRNLSFTEIYQDRTGRPSAPPVKPQQPKKHKAKLLVWTDLSVATVDRLNEAASADQVKQIFADMFMLEHHKTNPKAAIVMELLYNTFRFAKREKFSSESTSAFFSIIKNIFQVCVETPFENERYTQEYFKDLVQCHSTNNPPCSSPIFPPEDVVKISQYTMNTFFRHFNMYKHAFTSKVQLDLTLTYSVKPDSPPPISAASEDDEDIDDNDADSRQEEEEDSHRRPSDKDELKQEVLKIFSTEAIKIDEIISSQINLAAATIQKKLEQKITQPASVVNIEQTELPLVLEESDAILDDQ